MHKDFYFELAKLRAEPLLANHVLSMVWEVREFSFIPGYNFAQSTLLWTITITWGKKMHKVYHNLRKKDAQSFSVLCWQSSEAETKFCVYCATMFSSWLGRSPNFHSSPFNWLWFRSWHFSLNHYDNLRKKDAQVFWFYAGKAQSWKIIPCLLGSRVDSVACEVGKCPFIAVYLIMISLIAFWSEPLQWPEEKNAQSFLF